MAVNIRTQRMHLFVGLGIFRLLVAKDSLVSLWCLLLLPCSNILNFQLQWTLVIVNSVLSPILFTNERLFLSTLLFLPIGEIVLNSECTWLNIISLVASKKSDKKKGVKRGAGKSPELKKSQALQKNPRTFGLL